MSSEDTKPEKIPQRDSGTSVTPGSSRGAVWHARRHLRTLPHLVHQLGRWWLVELLALFPRRVSQWLMGRNSKAVVLFTETNAISLLLRSEGGQTLASASMRQADYSPKAIDDFVRAHQLRRNDVALGLGLPSANFFERKLVLPVEAAPTLDEIVARDLVLKTPFKLADIYHGFAASKASDADKIVVSQWVTRRTFVHDAAACAGLDPESIAFVEPVGRTVGNCSSPAIWLHGRNGGGSVWIRRSALALALSAVLLTIATGTLVFWRQQSTLDEIEARLAVVKPKAQQVRALINNLEHTQALLLRVRSRKSESAGLLDVWEETTRLLPLHSWLTELRLSEVAQQNEQRLAIIGFSTAAASIVGLVDASAFFAEAALAAPVSLDVAEERERFAIQTKLRRSGMRRGAP